ncbi:MAG: hypothetical protein CL677_02275 [Bdellovibrionaceae bacterium]|nr:hypothetical protein [Pseudobdellovibrionaceae bacterium]|tara:strand:+ start:162633 stop:164000 length:1368 start_codon:yes stop_codon:yes gene_type:complete
MKITLSRWKELFKIAWPLIVANSFWTLQMTIDRVFLGNYSTESLGAAMAVMAVFWTPMALLQQTASYVTTFVAQYLGSNKKESIGPSLWQGLYFSFVFGLLFLLLNFLSEDFFKAIGHSQDILILEVQYYNSVAFSALPTALVAAFSGFYTGLGKTRMVMAINGVGLIINVILDYLLIFGEFGFPELGIAGAGYATSLAGYGSAVFAAWAVFNKAFEKEFKVLSGWKFDLSIMSRFIKYGFPSGMQWALEGLAFTVFLMIIGRFPNGDVALAATSIAVTLMMLSVLPSMGVAQSVMALVGQHLGEGQPEKAAESAMTGVQMSSAYMICVGLSLVLIPDFYLFWFENKQNPELWGQVAEMSKYLLMFVAMFTLFDSFNFNLSFALKGAGDTKFVSLVSLILPWPTFVIPTVYISHLPNATYVAWGFITFYITLLALIYYLRFRQGKWKSMSVIDNN